MLRSFGGGSGGTSDHGALTGLGDDDHTQYTKADGTRAFTGDVSLGGFDLGGVIDIVASATSVYIKGSTGETLVYFANVAGAVNYTVWRNQGAGGSPRITFTGTDTDVGGIFETKGAGRIQVRYSGVNYEVATVDTAQTFANKTLTTPTIGSFVNATHDHSSASEGGPIGAAAYIGVVHAARFGFA